MQSLKMWTEACWDGYKQLGMKKKGGRKVPNCVPEYKEDEFSPHMMYDPETRKGYKAKTYDDHMRMKKMGYVHDLDELSPAAKRRAKKQAYLQKTMKKYADAAKMGIDAKDVNQRRNAPTRKKT